MIGRIKLLRIGQLTGDTINGVWNMTEAWPLMLSTVKEVGCLPRRTDKLTWLPLDIAARAVVDITFDETNSDHGYGCQVFHILNSTTETCWEDLLAWIKEVSSTPFDVVEPSAWARKVEKLESHPAKNLLWLWTEGRQEQQRVKATEPSFEVVRAGAISQAMRSVKPVDKELVEKIWRWIESETS